jgi:hypothetical protein
MIARDGNFTFVTFRIRKRKGAHANANWICIIVRFGIGLKAAVPHVGASVTVRAVRNNKENK